MQAEWTYDEGVQVGTNHRDDREVLEYDRNMRQIRNVAKDETSTNWTVLRSR